jgi:hypothetical protein
MTQTHLERLRELRHRQAERERELVRRRPLPSESGARADPGRRAQARAPLMRCQDCYYFGPWSPGNHGDCMAKDPPSWVTQAATRRPCPLFLSDPLGMAVQVLADRWQYSKRELAAALRGAAVDPAGWWRVTDADLEARLWPAPSGRS